MSTIRNKNYTVKDHEDIKDAVYFMMADIKEVLGSTIIKNISKLKNDGMALDVLCSVAFNIISLLLNPVKDSEHRDAFINELIMVMLQELHSGMCTIPSCTTCSTSTSTKH